MDKFSFDLELSTPIKILIGAFTVLLILFAVFKPLLEEKKKVQHSVQRAESEYLNSLKKINRYKKLQSSKGNKDSVLLEKKLFAYVEEVARNLKLNKKIKTMRPEDRTAEDGSKIEVVNVSFKGISLDEFVKFFYHIEVKKREIYVSNISIKKDNNKNLDADMTIRKLYG